MPPGRVLIAASAVAELEALPGPQERREVAAAVAELSGGAAGRRLGAGGAGRVRGRRLTLLYRERGDDLVLCAIRSAPRATGR